MHQADLLIRVRLHDLEKELGEQVVGGGTEADFEEKCIFTCGGIQSKCRTLVVKSNLIHVLKSIISLQLTLMEIFSFLIGCEKVSSATSIFPACVGVYFTLKFVS